MYILVNMGESVEMHICVFYMNGYPVHTVFNLFEQNDYSVCGPLICSIIGYIYIHGINTLICLLCEVILNL